MTLFLILGKLGRSGLKEMLILKMPQWSKEALFLLSFSLKTGN